MHAPSTRGQTAICLASKCTYFKTHETPASGLGRDEEEGRRKGHGQPRPPLRHTRPQCGAPCDTQTAEPCTRARPCARAHREHAQPNGHLLGRANATFRNTYDLCAKPYTPERSEPGTDPPGGSTPPGNAYPYWRDHWLECGRSKTLLQGVATVDGYGNGCIHLKWVSK